MKLKNHIDSNPHLHPTTTMATHTSTTMNPQKSPIQNQHLPCIWSSQSEFKAENQAKKKTQSSSAIYMTKDQKKKPRWNHKEKTQMKPSDCPIGTLPSLERAIRQKGRREGGD